MEKLSFGGGEEHPSVPKMKASDYLKTISQHPGSFAKHVGGGLLGGYAAGAGLGVLATIPIAAAKGLMSSGGKFNSKAFKTFKEKMGHGLQSEAVGFGGVGLVAGAGKFFNKYKGETPDARSKAVLQHVKKAAFENEMKKLATNYVAINAGKGGKWGAIAGGSVAGLTSHQIMTRLVKAQAMKKFAPFLSKAKTPVIAASMLAAAIAGGNAGAYLGAGVGGAEKITSHLQ